MASELVALIVFMAISGGVAVLAMPFLLIRMVLDRKLKIAEMKVRANEDAVRDAVRPLREEVARLRQETNDLVLGFDTTLARLDERLQRLEAQLLASPQESARSLPGPESRSWIETQTTEEPERVVVNRKPR